MLFQCSSIEPAWECAATSGPPRPLQALEIQVEARAGDVMAGGGVGAAGPAQDVQHQPAGDISMQVYIHNFPLVTYRVSGVCTLAVQR